MKWISNRTVNHLQRVSNEPDFGEGRYRMVRQIGRGGMGAVYLAIDTKLGREVAIKLLDPANADEEMRSRMVREAEILARLEHPGIVPIHDMGELVDGRVYYAMKLVRGSRLDQKLEDLTSLSERLLVFRYICEAVAFAHTRSVLHRDLKPENIMVGPFGEVLVLDWGVAKVVNPADQIAPEFQNGISGFAPIEQLDGHNPDRQTVTETRNGSVIGTPAYMAPEQARGEIADLDERTDVFGLGAILYFLLTDRAPFSDKRREAEERAIPPLLRTLNPKLPKALQAICHTAMSFNADDRYQTVSELLSDIQRFAAGGAVSAYRENPAERAARWVRNNHFIVLLVVAYLVMRLLLIFYSRS